MIERNNALGDLSQSRGECAGCEGYTEVNDLGLCDECTAKLDRDLIRARDWDYSVSAFGVSRDKREDLRNQVIKTYGRSMELIAEESLDKKSKEKKNRKKAKRKKQRRKGPKV